MSPKNPPRKEQGDGKIERAKRKKGEEEEEKKKSNG